MGKKNNTQQFSLRTSQLFSSLPFFSNPITSARTSSREDLGVNEALDLLQPGLVLALLLDVHVVGDEDSEGLGDAALLEVAFHEDLEVLVKAAEGRARVDVLGSVVGFGCGAVSVLGVLEVIEVVDHDLTVLSKRLDVQRALARLLHDNVQPTGDGRLALVAGLYFLLLAFGLGRLLGLRRIQLLVAQGAVLEVGIRLVVSKVGDGERYGDAETDVTLLARNPYNVPKQINK